MSSSKRNIYIYLGKVILITLLIVLFVRCFIVESFTVSSSQMETTLQDGDKVLIDKTAYGIRMPITVLSIPFTFDRLWGRKSYSDAIQMPYARFFTGQIGKDEVILYNNPLEYEKPLDKRSLLLARCVSLPGDTVLIDNRLTTSEDSYLQSADSLSNKNMLEIVLPFKGQVIALNEENLIIYGQTIQQEQGNAVTIIGGKLFIDGKEQSTYTFQDDYYWMLSDNDQSVFDSRSLGFIPFSNVIGKARFVWYNPNPTARKARCLKAIK